MENPMDIKSKLTQAAHRLEGQPMFRLLDRVKALEATGKDIIHFEIGDPDFDTPRKITEACIRSLKAGETHYASSSGLIKLRQAVCAYLQADLGFRPDLEQVVISPGANALIYFIIQCLVHPDEEVLVPDPAFSTYYSVLKLLNIKAVRVPLKEENNFRMDPSDIERKITSKTKLIIINSPQNPTGSVMTPQEINQVYDIAVKHDLFILSDEIYRLMSYGVPVASPAVRDFCKERTMIITGFSKSFAMTGWRLGYMIGPQAIVDKVSLLIQTIASCVSPFIQMAGVEALKAPHEETKKMMAELRKRRDFIVHELNQLPGIHCVKPDGAFYVFPSIKQTKMTSDFFAELMLEKAGVSLLPGPSFGEHCEGYVRLCYANSLENISEGIKRIRRVLEKSV
jgi:aspartate/methionine/tyrosine aminotransferase